MDSLMENVCPTDNQPRWADETATDAELMRAICTSDQAAFSALYDRYAPKINGICLRVLRSSTEAEAAVSDVFLEIWQKPTRFNASRGKFATYLFTLARCRAIDRLRASTTRSEKTKLAAEEAPTVEKQEPIDFAAAGEWSEFVRHAIDDLTDVQRSALNLAYFEGLTHKQIAEKLKRPLGTVKTDIRRGLQALRIALKAFEERDELR